jgi:hypothetical protein
MFNEALQIPKSRYEYFANIFGSLLTPKGPLVPTRNKPVLGSVI